MQVCVQAICVQLCVQAICAIVCTSDLYASVCTSDLCASVCTSDLCAIVCTILCVCLMSRYVKMYVLQCNQGICICVLVTTQGPWTCNASVDGVHARKLAVLTRLSSAVLEVSNTSRYRRPSCSSQ
jgi:hypothetical protein